MSTTRCLGGVNALPVMARLITPNPIQLDPTIFANDSAPSPGVDRDGGGRAWLASQSRMPSGKPLRHVYNVPSLFLLSKGASQHVLSSKNRRHARH